MQYFSLALLLVACLCGCAHTDSSSNRSGETSVPPANGTELSVMTWNIWHGGREDGEEAGPQRVIDIIKASGADLVAMQETYGSGELISGALGYNFHPRGTNVSIHSRYPIVQDVSVFHEFKCVGAIVELPGGQHVAFYSIWLPYGKEIWAVGTRDGLTNDEMLAACDASRVDLEQIMQDITARLAETEYAGVPVIVAGDFNSMSHFDYVDSAKDQFGYVIDWPTSHVMTDAGFADSYRSLHTQINRVNDRTWTPRFLDQQQDRIDYVYYKGPGVKAIAAEVVDEHAPHRPAPFPSDHAALVVRLRIEHASSQEK